MNAYQLLYGTDVACQPVEPHVFDWGPLLNDEQRSSLTRPVLDQKIKNAFFCIGDDKAPGPNGYSSHFFKRS